jgi:predicted DNA-binding helix-hairpin-helix protein
MALIKSQIAVSSEEKKTFKNSPLFVPGGQSTQLIVGATADNDFNILKLTENLYKKYSLKRVYYSAYVPVNTGKNLPDIKHPPLIREHRLYQADWLLRFYGFNATELLNEATPNFHQYFDPKTNYAINNLDKFPMEVNTASYEALLRVPGIGVRSAKRIVITRKVNYLNFEDLKKLGVVLKRAQYFITCRGKYYGDVSFAKEAIENRLIPGATKETGLNLNFEQLSFLPQLPAIINPIEKLRTLHGEFWWR